jgi:LmbE family N-acetylglucosaminyl deacetylase
MKAIIFSAHSDDFVIGAGGYMALHPKQTHCVVFSMGEMSHPWLKPEEIKKVRRNEMFQAAKILRSTVTPYDLNESNFLNENDSLVQESIEWIEKHKPTRVFTHSSEDPHPDHRAVHETTMEIVSKLSYQIEVYTYSIWNPTEFNQQYPALYIDIKQTYQRKVKSMKAFPSQKVAIYTLAILIMYRAVSAGLRSRYWLAEKFYRIL